MPSPSEGSEGTSDDRASLERGREALRGGRLVEATHCFARLLERTPDDPEALTGLAWARRASGDLVGALELFTRASRSAPDDPVAVRHVVRETRDTGNPGVALALAEEALLRLPADPGLTVERAHSLERLDHPLVDDAWRRALGAAPDDPEVLLAAARSALRRGSVALARQRLERAVGQGGAPAPVLDLAELELRAGAAERASELVACVEGWPPEARRRALAVRARAALLLGDLTAAADHADQLEHVDGATTEDRAEALGLRAEVALSTARADVAVGLLAEADRLRPSVPRLRLAVQASLRMLDPVTTRHLQAAEARSVVTAGAADTPWRPGRGLAGDIANELLLDPATLDAARGALDDGDPGAALAGVRRRSMALAPALALLAVLDRAGLPPIVPSIAGDDEISVGDPIPRILHQAWVGGPVPDDVAALVDGWRGLHPEWFHRLLDDAGALSVLHAHEDGRALRAFRAAPDATRRADLLRLVLLHDLGGVWVDADDRALRPLDGLLARGGLIVALDPYGAVGNDVIAAPPRHPVIRDALDEVAENLIAGGRESPWLATGPAPLTRALCRRLASSGESTPGTRGVTVLRQGGFARHVAPAQDLAYKRTDAWWRTASHG